MVTTKSKAKSKSQPKSQPNTKTPSRTKAKPKAAPDNQVNKQGGKQADNQAGILGGSGDHRMIGLNKLKISPKNVRRIKASEADDGELLASIRQQGVKQNLVVHPGPEGTFLVDAGGRRLKALQTLAEEGAIPEDHGVACLVEDEAEATLISLTENTQRAAMHPADQFMAFSAMIEEGLSEDEIALKFGVSVDLVRRRLKLARVAPQIFDAFRDDEITLEAMMAFTITDHHDRQMTVWDSLKDSYNFHPHSIKRLLTQTSYSANSRLGVFVGQEAYEEAGGAIMSDLFADRDATYFENPELVERLALERLHREAEVFKAKWSWVDVHLELESGALRSFGHFNRKEVDPDPALLKEIETLTARADELAEAINGGGLDDEQWQEYNTIEPRIEEIEEKIEKARPFAETDYCVGGAILTIDNRGQLRVLEGLVRPEEMPDWKGEGDDDRLAAPTSSAAAPVADSAGALRKTDGITQGLAEDLRTSRHHILKAHLASDYDTAFDAMLYCLCKKALGSCYARGLPLDVSLSQYYSANGDKVVAGSVAEHMLEAIEEGLNVSLMLLDQPDDFRALSNLISEEKQALFAWATAYCLKAQLSTDGGAGKITEELGVRMNVDVAACWRPTAANYWGTVTKAHIASVAGEVIGDEFGQERSSEKKGEAAAAMEVAFGEAAIEASGLAKDVAARSLRWLPKGMEFAGVTDANRADGFDLSDNEAADQMADQMADGPVDEPVDEDDAGTPGPDGDLPAFLQGNAAA